VGVLGDIIAGHEEEDDVSDHDNDNLHVSW
jgi:hypothetical protein